MKYIIACLHIFGFILAPLFGVLWILLTFETDFFDLVIIGHIKEWKRIKIPNLVKAIKKNKPGKELIEDNKTHPQVFIVLLFDILFNVGYYFLFAYYFVPNAMNIIFVWVFDFCVYLIGISKLIIFKTISKKEYQKYINNQQKEDIR